MMNDYFVMSKYHSFFILTPPPPPSSSLLHLFLHRLYEGGEKEKLTNSLQISDKIVRGDTAGI